MVVDKNAHFDQVYHDFSDVDQLYSNIYLRSTGSPQTISLL